MIKSEELSNPQSCLNRALSEERIFVLLARDASAPAAIRTWVRDRVGRGLNELDDQHITEALACADAMEAERASVREALQTQAVDNSERCAVCGWRLAGCREDGCVSGDCSLRPRPAHLYAPARAAAEAAEALGDSAVS